MYHHLLWKKALISPVPKAVKFTDIVQSLFSTRLDSNDVLDDPLAPRRIARNCGEILPFSIANLRGSTARVG